MDPNDIIALKGHNWLRTIVTTILIIVTLVTCTVIVCAKLDRNYKAESATNQAIASLRLADGSAQFDFMYYPLGRPNRSSVKPKTTIYDYPAGKIGYVYVEDIDRDYKGGIYLDKTADIDDYNPALRYPPAPGPGDSEYVVIRRIGNTFQVDTAEAAKSLPAYGSYESHANQNDRVKMKIIHLPPAQQYLKVKPVSAKTWYYTHPGRKLYLHLTPPVPSRG